MFTQKRNAPSQIGSLFLRKGGAPLFIQRVVPFPCHGGAHAAEAQQIPHAKRHSQIDRAFLCAGHGHGAAVLAAVTRIDIDQGRAAPGADGSFPVNVLRSQQSKKSKKHNGGKIEYRIAADRFHE